MNHLMRLLALLPLLQLPLWQPASGYNYCHNETHACSTSGMKHFICRLDEELHPLNNRAKYVATIPDTMKLRGLILDYHNKYRNKLAGGDLTTDNNKTFKSAARMRELIWDPELAYMARIHASTVSFKHSLCRSVLRFPYAGECLGLIYASTERRTITDLLDLTLLAMFEEYQEAEDPDDVITKFDPARHANMGHFTVLVSDRVSRVGCGIVLATDCDKGSQKGYCHYLTCHYDFTNLADSYVYKPGEPASKCGSFKAKQSDKYRNLCTNTGQIFAINHGQSENKFRSIISRF